MPCLWLWAGEGLLWSNTSGALNFANDIFTAREDAAEFMKGQSDDCPLIMPIEFSDTPWAIDGN